MPLAAVLPRLPARHPASDAPVRTRSARLPGLLLACAGWLVAAPPLQAATLQAFESEQAFQDAWSAWRQRALAVQRARPRLSDKVAMPAAGMTADAAPPPMALSLAQAPAAALQQRAEPGTAPSAPSAADESITNVQTAGVDEGGIVKRAGDHLVILRRGRLFTVRVGGDALAPVAMVDAYGPNADPRGAWYDELLISGSTVVVIGYSVARGATEIGLFELGADGSLAYRATWHLRSGDYYASRNFASRLVGQQLIFYAPLMLHPGEPVPRLPGLRRWRAAAAPSDFRPILPATRIYRTDEAWDDTAPLALHTVTRCDIQGAELNCSADAVMGPPGRVFYVSAGSVYVWTSRPRWAQEPRGEAGPAPSAVFRLPLNGGAPTALKTRGVPVDALSFLEDAGGRLNVLLRRDGAGEGLWGGESTTGTPMALLRVPLSAFGDGRQAAAREHYRPLPAAPDGALNNRYVGDWLLWGTTGSTRAWALPLSAQRGPVTLEVGHGIERIEALGAHAVLVGQWGEDLVFTAARLGAGEARLTGRYLQPRARSSESRTHGFFYRPSGDEEGLLGLPIVRSGSGSGDDGAWPGRQPGAAASVLFLRQRQLDFASLGSLSARPGRSADDGCRASCVDWYGQSRPIFLGDRVFALLGYELVEGRLAGRPGPLPVGEADGWPRPAAGPERLVERRRIDFGPRAVAATHRPWPFE